jgi:branched-chain amino acid aminotransferase
MGRHVSLNGVITPSEKAAVSVSDRGLLYGDGIYETIRAANGNCIRFDAHMARLRQGASLLGMTSALDGYDLSNAVGDLLKANGLTDARIRITVTRTPTVLITADPLSEFTMETSRAIISSYRRDEKNPLTGIKSLNCLTSIMARREAESAGFDDAILLNTEGGAAEGTTANIFVLTGNRLITPSLDQGCLPGITRSAVLEIAATLGFEVEEKAITPDTLSGAEELFFSSAIKLLRPITHLSDSGIGDGKYPVCERLLNQLLRQME